MTHEEHAARTNPIYRTLPVTIPTLPMSECYRHGYYQAWHCPGCYHEEQALLMGGAQ